MNKRKVNWLISLVIVAMAGIISMQWIWMKNAYDVRNELFDRSVNEALVSTSVRMEQLSDVFTFDYIIGQNHRHTLPPPPRMPQIRPDSLMQISRLSQKQIKIIARQLKNGDQVKIDSLVSNWQNLVEKNADLFMNDSTIARHQNDSIKHFQWRVENRIRRLKSMTRKMAYETWSDNRQRTPDPQLLQQTLAQELANRNVTLKFDLGILNNNQFQPVTANADSTKIKNDGYQAKLNPNEVFDSNQKLLVYFPGRRMFLLKALITPISLSVLFSAFIMITFILSIHHILKQKKISEMKSDFINNMTHEFKTPLATISVATDTLVNKKVIDNPEQIRRFSEIIKKENARMNTQVETILQIARLDHKDFEFNFKVVNIHELISRAVQGIELQIANRGGTIETHLNAANPIITTDAQHTRNMLNNLLDNANKYTPENPRIVVTTRNSERGVWISVADNGIGMNKQVQTKIFEKFYRETSGNIHNVKGFGLGLSYVKAVIDANKGEIKVSSQPGQGSTFEVFIPFALNV